MKVAAITLTKGGLILARKLQQYNEDIHVYSTKKYDMKPLSIINLPLQDNIKSLLEEYDMIIFIMATGIVVRVIAPYIKHKTIDPGIIVMDEKGKYVISLLSGHIGGANKYTEELANFLDASPVITTSSDVNKTIAVDMLAMKLNCHIDNLEYAKIVTSHIVNNYNIGIISSIPINIKLPSQFIKLNEENIEDNINKYNLKGLINISDNRLQASCPISHLIPKNIIAGIGCRRGKTKEEIVNQLIQTCNEYNVDINKISKISTVEVKKDEVGLIELAKTLKVPLEIISLDSIRKVQNIFEGSSFVEKTIGVKCVCEPCGYISSNYGECIVNKIKNNGITISLWETRRNMNE
ncbi:MAG: cobalt-precorrin 5A hydrolase [Vallitalea sp.]|jgi:cobalt-precorrin 5A hydrolase|nr:cobalt-precorrin 5A hydrolase [Vallitalea sp.]